MARLGALLVALVLAVGPQTVGIAVAAAALPGASPPYYLALGDSLAQGVQPNRAGTSVETDRGYADDLWSRYHATTPNLRLAKLGCPGETTGTMINGGICAYSTGSQLAQAAAFLATHRVVLVTLDIGANNIDGCVSGAGLDRACLAAGLAAVGRDLPIILHALKQAGPQTLLVAMNYYDPFVAAALKGGALVSLAVQSEQLGATFNTLLATVYAGFGVPVADVARYFAPLNLPSLPYLDLPIDLVLVCGYTWMCAPAPAVPNIHATGLGYRVIAQAFAHQIG